MSEWSGSVPWRLRTPGWGGIHPAQLLRGALEAERDRWFLWLPLLFGVGIGLYFTLLFEPPLWLR